MTTPLWTIVVVLVACVIAAFGALFLKMGSAKILFNIKTIIYNKKLLFGIVAYGIATIMFIPALKYGELSVLYPFAATSRPKAMTTGCSFSVKEGWLTSSLASFDTESISTEPWMIRILCGGTMKLDDKSLATPRETQTIASQGGYSRGINLLTIRLRRFFFKARLVCK